jgi:hypothetical protein
MRLGNFILRDMELILERWELFASTYLPPAAHMSSLSVRGHLSEILEAIVADLQNPHTRSEQSAKSMGLAVSAPGAPLTAAQMHALARVESGFDIDQLSAEFRALRASVLGGWMDACLPKMVYVDDIMGFNEAIDQVMAEATGIFAANMTPSTRTPA